MIRKLLPFLFLLLLSCESRPQIKDVKNALEGRYRWFGDVIDVRLINMIKIDDETYVAQIKYGIRFRENLSWFERELKKELGKEKDLKNLKLFLKIFMLNDLLRKCGLIEKGRVCYMTATVKFKKVRLGWAPEL